jgi:hypothetical protein
MDKKLVSLAAIPAAAAMNDVFLVISEARDRKRSARRVLAGDEDQARHAHLDHYPDEHIVAVKAQG